MHPASRLTFVFVVNLAFSLRSLANPIGNKTYEGESRPLLSQTHIDANNKTLDTDNPHLEILIGVCLFLLALLLLFGGKEYWMKFYKCICMKPNLEGALELISENE